MSGSKKRRKIKKANRNLEYSQKTALRAKEYRKRFLVLLLVNMFFAVIMILLGLQKVVEGSRGLSVAFLFRRGWGIRLILALIYSFFAALILASVPKKISIVINKFIFSMSLACLMLAILFGKKWGSGMEAGKFGQELTSGERVQWMWVIAIILSLLLIYASKIAAFWQRLLEVIAKERTESKEARRKRLQCRVLFSFSIALFFTFTLIFFGPLEIFIGNSVNYEFALRDFWWIPIRSSVMCLIALTLLFSLLPDVLCYLGNMVVFAFTLCCYLQALFFNSEMESLMVGAIDWSKETIYGNMAVWMGLLIVLFCLPFLLKDRWKSVVQFIALSIVLMQFTALISLLLTTDVLVEEKDGYVSRRNMLELSDNKNVVVFILDFFDGRTMEKILADDLDVLEPLNDGFTYFPNATSVYSRTYPSIAYLLTGSMCYFDKKPNDWVNEAYRGSDFLPTLAKKDIDIGVYTNLNYLGNSAKHIMCNYEASKLTLDMSKLTEYLRDMIMYRDMPYILKKGFEYQPAEVNNEVVLGSVQSSEGRESDRFVRYNDEWFYDTMVEERIHLTDRAGCFRFYHLTGPHLTLWAPETSGKRALEIVYEYIDQMKKLGIYDDSTIIITTDHGNSGGGDTLDMPQGTAVPILFVKPAGAGNTELYISEAPVSQTELIPTVLEGFSMPHAEGTFFDIKENEPRERYYHYTALYSDVEGEIELREYLVDGDARDARNYHYTGKAWDIIYSENAVANKKAADKSR